MSVPVPVSVCQLGESGKSTRELEKTIALLKKVVERVQQENEKLKKAPGVVSSEQMALVKRENEGLKVRNRFQYKNVKDLCFLT